jgi:hypothetical protein
MLFATLRFLTKGWVSELYLQPQFFFHYYGLSFVKPLTTYGLPDWLTYAVFIAMAVAALGILLGYYYRVSALSFALLFTYTELWDASNYLNHYYFVSLLSFLLVLLPAHRAFSLDVRRKPQLAAESVPFWTVFVLQLQLGIVYFMAGVAKIHPDWLLEAQPLRLWLAAHSNFPLLGSLFTYTWVAYFFSWFGLVYDLSIPFWLSHAKTRPLAYTAVVAFHVLTWLLFPIGVFPWVMIGLTLIYFPAPFHQRILQLLAYRPKLATFAPSAEKMRIPKLLGPALVVFFAFQLVFPFRYLAYPGNLFWTEQGYRFSWRVMLMEKVGMAQFTVVDRQSGKAVEVNNRQYLTPRQEKMMATQPDFMLQYTHFLAREYQTAAGPAPAVYVESYVALNGHRSQRFVPQDLDLTTLEDSWAPKTWLLPFSNNSKTSQYAVQ